MHLWDNIRNVCIRVLLFMKCRCGQYSVFRCDGSIFDLRRSMCVDLRRYGAPLLTIFGDELSVQCFRLRSSKMDVSTFGDRSVDHRRSMIDVSTFEDMCDNFRKSMCRPSDIDVSTFRRSMCRLAFEDRCEIILLHLLKTLIL